MELSSEVYDLLERFKTLPKHNDDTGGQERISGYEAKKEDEIVHLEDIHFVDDETWLYRTKQETGVQNLHKWLHNGADEINQESPNSQSIKVLSQMGKNSPSKLIDSRTFTRPKKRYSRPSIEKYNEELFDLNISENNPSLIAAKLQEIELDNDDNSYKTLNTQSKPLNFDLSQPTNTSMFEQILADAPMLDSFQNMSPPSLVNSMCSSTFTTLMENSYIKNDPVLREIRDTDYSETILLQDSDSPMFQSITDSLCSEKTENFIKNTLQTTYSHLDNVAEEQERASLKNDIRKELEELQTQENSSNYSLLENLSCRISSDNSGSDIASEDLNVTNDIHQTLTTKQDTTHHQNTDMNATIVISTTPTSFNGTYKKSSKLFSATKTAMNVSTDSLDDNYLIKNQVQNTTYYATPQSVAMNDTFRLDKRRSVADIKINDSYNYDMNSANLKRNSAGSADSLDRMSSLSNTSSRGSSRMLNMSEVDAIVEQQEKSLQIMSTPKPTINYRKLCSDTLLLSPIGNTLERSDSDLSSSDDYVTGRTSLSKGSPASSDSGALNYTGRTIKPVRSANAILQPTHKNPVRSINTLTKNVRTIQPAGSYTNLHNLKGSQICLQKAGSHSNLKTVTSQLRGSYTSLKPVNKILPVAPPPLNSTQVYSSHSEANRTVQLKRTETFKVPLPVGDAHQLPVVDVVGKPVAKVSNLPKPVLTGIPRPVSRIPGPRIVKSANSQPNIKQTKQLKERNYY